MNDMDQAALLELISGKRNSSVVAAILQNPKELKEAFEDANNASGSALRENEKYLDSIQGKIDQFNNAVQSMWSNTLNADWVKTIVEVGTKIINLVDDVGMLNLALTGLFMLISTKYMNMNWAHPIKSFKSMFGKPVADDINLVKDNLKQLEVEYESAKQAFAADPSKSNKKNLDNVEGRLQEYKLINGETISFQDNLANAQSELAKAQSRLDNYTGKNANTIKKYQGDVKRAQANVDALTRSQQQAAQTGATGWQRLGVKVSGFAEKVQSAVASMLVMYAISKIMSLVGDLWDKARETAEEAKESFEELTSELSKTKSELSTLESQLSDIQSQIEDINDNTPLSFTDQEELSRLEAQSAELQRQIDLLNTIKEQQAIGLNKSAMNAANKYARTGVKTGKTTGENVGSKALGGAGIGAGIGVATGVGGSILAAAGLTTAGGAMAAGTALWAWAGPIGMLIGAAVGAIAGAAVGAAVGGIQSASEEKVGESLDNMKSEYERLQSEYKEARANYQADASDKNKKKFEKAQEAFNTYQSNMAGYMTEMDSYYSQIKQNWDQATTEQKQEYIEWQDTMDTWAIQSGGENAKSNAISRIFGDEATGNIAKARDEINKLKENLEKAKDSGQGVDEALAALNNYKLNLSDEEVARLREIGIYLYEVEDYFKEVIKAESEFVDSDLEDVAKDIGKITDGLDSLKTAFDEVIDKGTLTAKTILDLKNALSIGTDDTQALTDAWNEYLQVMMSGTASTDEMVEATERLTQAWIEDALANNSLKPETKMEYIAQLRSLGVTNAEEYVNDLLQKNMVRDLRNAQGLDISAIQKKFFEENGNDAVTRAQFAALSTTQLEEYAKRYGIVNKSITDAHKQEIMGRYGVEEDAIDEIVNQLNQKANLEQQVLNKQKQQASYNQWLYGDATKNGVLALQEELGAYSSVVEQYKSFSDKAKSFNNDFWTAVSGSYGTQLRNSRTGEVLNRSDFEALKMEAERFNAWAQNNQEKYDQYLKLKQQYDDLLVEGNHKGYFVGGKIIDPNFQAQIDTLNQQIADIETEIDTELTVDVQLQLDLQNQSELVDDIQNVFDTLVSAKKEYDENGYLSVDTLQNLLQLEPKYLDLLVDEEGNLNLTKDALYGVARARIIDMGIQSQKNILENATALASKGSADALREHITVMQEANELGGDFVEVEMAKIRAILAEKVAAGDLTQTEADAFVDGVMNQIEAVQVATQSAIDSLDNSLSTSGNTATEVAKSDWEKLVSYYENQLALITNERNLIESEIDKAEARGGKAAAQYYEDLIRNSSEEKALLEEQYSAMKRYLDANADTIDQDTWTEYNNSLNEIAVSIKECETNTIQWQEALREIDIHYFEQANDEISRLGNELEFVNGLLEDEEVADENGNWSSAALTRMGMYMNQIEAAAADTQRYQDEIAKLNQQYAAGELSEEQYQERLGTLTDGLYDSINAQEDARDGIVELNEARIDAIKEGIEKEIEAYEDYIDVVKESLDAQRDLYDFKNKVKNQTKDIAQLERRIASLSGATDASSVAERRKLEAQLLEAKEGLNDTYYDHSKDTQQNALDSEAESYRESQEKRIEELEKTLEDTETLIYNSMMDVLFNADTVYNELNAIADTYGVTLSEELTQPWADASTRALAWKDELKASMTSGEYAALIGEGGAITLFANGVADKLSGSWDTAKSSVKTYSDFLTGSELDNKFSNTITGFANQIQKIIDKWTGVKNAADSAYRAQVTASSVGGNVNNNGNGNNNTGYQQYVNKQWHATATYSDGIKTLTATGTGSTQAAAEEDAKENLYTAYYNYKRADTKEEDIWKIWDRNQSKVKVAAKEYAKGTTGTPHDQWAITDEPLFGDELVLVPGKDGNLSYMRKGTGVVPADLTANLMEWGQFTPESLNLGAGVNINMINNAVIKPQYDFNFDSLVHVDHCDQGTLKDLEKMVDNKIDKFSKDLNYSIKRYSR